MRRSPRLEELPAPPPDRVGWPWTEASPAVEVPMAEGRPWPRISVVTPSYNQGQFIEETIRSVLLQGYPDSEYIIMDGGSTDGSVEIIKRYERWLAYWESAPDRGQAHAINKGLERLTGSVFTWLNSDDYLLPGALQTVGRHHWERPDAILAAPVIDFVDGTDGELQVVPDRLTFRHVVEFWTDKAVWPIPGMFYPAKILSKTGPFDESLRHYFDYDFLCRVLQAAHPCYLGKPVVRFRLHESSKSLAEGHLFLLEAAQVTKRYWGFIPDVDVRGYTRSVSKTLFRSGCSRVLRGHPGGLRLMAAALRVQPVWAICSALGELPSYLRRRLRGAR